MHPPLFRISLGAAILSLHGMLAVPSPSAAQDIRTERVRFDPGASSATIEASIKGYEIVDYVLGAREGQYMNASMATDNGANYFNIMAPGESEVAFFNGSVAENQYEGVLPASGDYRIRVYMMRSAARRDEVANYRLEVIIGDIASGEETGDALVEGTEYHATGSIPCSMGNGQPTGACAFGVVREGGGNGMVTVTKPDGSERVIFFEGGVAIGSDASEADGGEFRASKDADLSVIHIGQERYQIPDAVIFGG